MKRILAILLALMLLCAAVPAGAMVSAAGNLLANGNFETGDASGWVIPGWCSNQVIVDAAYAKDGYGVGLTGNWAGLYQVVPVTPNTDYELTFWTKGYTVVYFKDGNNEDNVLDERWPEEYDEWTQVTYEINTASCTNLLIELNAGAHTCSVDNVAFTSKGDDDDNIYNDEELDWTDVLDIDPADVKSVSLRTLPDKVVYAYGEALDTTGLTLLVEYGEDDRIILYGDYEVSGYDAQTAGEQTITITALGKTVTFTVIVEAEEEEGTVYPISDVIDKIKTQGRNLLVGSSLMLDFSASAIEFTAECEGSVYVTFNVKRLATTDPTLGGVYFTIVVDGKEMARDACHLTETGEITMRIARGLTAGHHTFAIYRQTEHAEAEVGVSAITLNGTLQDKPADNKLYIEFVGDSISVGQCNLAKKSTAKAGKPLYQDATKAYPFLTAQALGADYSNVSWSGAGCKYGYAGLCMQDIYPLQRYNYDRNKKFDFNVRPPHIVVLALGTNDALNQKDEAARKAGLVEMLTMVREKNPMAKIVWIYNMMTDEVNQQIQDIVAEFGGAEKGYYCVQLTKNTSGGDGHPDVAGHEVMAQELAQFITDNVKVDTRKPVGLEITSAPDKSQYLLGEPLDTTGLVLEVIYDDGSKESITEGYTLTGYHSATVGVRKITVKYLDMTVTFEVEVFKKLPTDTYTVIFNANGGTGEMEPVEDIVDEIVLPTCGFVAPDGSHFKAWEIDGVEYAPGATYPVTVDTVVNAVWEKDPIVLNGWIKEDGKWAYYVNDVKTVNAWKKDSNGWCYLGADGYMLTDKWVKDSVGWCYVGANGYCVTNTWKKDSVGWCYLDENGRMATNKWVKDSIGWCYVGADGYAVTNTFKKDSTGWCYLNASGSMVKNNWVKDGGKWYFLDANGYMVSNKWMKDSKGWVWVGSDGAMVTNKWLKDSVGWCYVGDDGYCLTSQWKKDSKGWCYLDKNGRMVYDKWVDGFYVNKNGYWIG